jgi:hypothetical protein
MVLPKFHCKLILLWVAFSVLGSWRAMPSFLNAIRDAFVCVSRVGK